MEKGDESLKQDKVRKDYILQSGGKRGKIREEVWGGGGGGTNEWEENEK